jgi:hypothetical protein
LLILPIVFCFTGCSEEQLGSKDRTILQQYVFKGENESWYAELTFNGERRFTDENGRISYDSWATEEFSVYYMEDLSRLLKAKHLVITYETFSGSGSMSMNFPEDAPWDKVFRFSSGSNGSFISQDEPVTVTITTDGQSQTFELVNKTSVKDRVGFLLGVSPLEEREKMLERINKK